MISVIQVLTTFACCLYFHPTLLLTPLKYRDFHPQASVSNMEFMTSWGRWRLFLSHTKYFSPKIPILHLHFSKMYPQLPSKGLPLSLAFPMQTSNRLKLQHLAVIFPLDLPASLSCFNQILRTIFMCEKTSKHQILQSPSVKLS